MATLNISSVGEPVKKIEGAGKNLKTASRSWAFLERAIDGKEIYKNSY